MLNNQMVYSHKSIPVLSTTSESRENTPAIPVFLLFGHVGNWVISQFDIYSIHIRIGVSMYMLYWVHVVSCLGSPEVVSGRCAVGKCV